ncbi:MAG: C25 family cysteine peptidase [Euryarchaeota archaeon]|nr:C25 family cysteine peptidase [Euryarchaeota archaeon]
MKYKISPFLVVAILIFSGIGVTAINLDDQNNKQSVVSKAIFSNKVVVSKGEYISVNLDNTNTFLIEAGKPILPSHTETFTFPLGTKIKNVECVIPSDITKEIISKKIEPAPKPVLSIYIDKAKISNNSVEKEIVEDSSIYTSSNLYPDKWYDYNIGCGLDKGQHVIFLTVQTYPVRYSPAENTIYYTNDVDVKITFEKPTNSVKFADTYDMVIIAPKKFSAKLQPLIKHKNDIGVSTILKTTEDIYANYKGRDEPEQIKYFIKDAIENWGVKYVLLVGGMKGQRNSWYVPVRYVNLEDIDWVYNETSYISDLYYADVYKYNESSGGYEFDNWDSNGNGIFAEWKSGSHFPQDTLDLHPDVIVGRLACRNTYEVGTVVKKIIKYETSTADKEWFKRLVLVGGDSVPTDDNYYEGEIETNLSASYMQPLGFDITRLWTSTGALKGQRDVIREINRGAGFIHFSGHGTPMVLSTYIPHNETWIDCLYTFNMYRLKNRYKLPIVVVGGCHSSQFNVTFLNFFKGLREERLKYFVSNEDYMGSFWKNEWIPECWSWHMVSKRNGGSIAVIGNTGLGYIYPGDYTLNGLEGWIDTRFFYEIGVQGKTTLGQAHSQAITDYVENFPVHTDRIDCKTIQQWTLLGDPSLKIG